MKFEATIRRIDRKKLSREEAKNLNDLLRNHVDETNRRTNSDLKTKYTKLVTGDNFIHVLVENIVDPQALYNRLGSKGYGFQMISESQGEQR